MKTKVPTKKRYDAVAMVREIRDAHYRRDTDPNFDPAELKRIKAKWTTLLEEQMKEDASAGVAQPKSGPGIMEQLRDIREQMSLEMAGMNLKEIQAYLKARGSLKDSLPARTPRRRPKSTVVSRTKAKT
jgi:hypothetical protein